MNKNSVQSASMFDILLTDISSSEEFAIILLEEIHKSLNEDNGLFSCNCSCKKNRLLIELTAEEITLDGNMFEYSLESGFYPFNFVMNLYSKFSKKDFVFVYIRLMDRDCLEDEEFLEDN
jgi:hypothetical protein